MNRAATLAKIAAVTAALLGRLEGLDEKCFNENRATPRIRARLDTVAFARNIEDAYRSMMETHPATASS